MKRGEVAKGVLMCEVLSPPCWFLCCYNIGNCRDLGGWSVRRRVAGWLVRNRAEVMLFFLQPLLVVLGAGPLACTGHESLDRSMGAVTRRTAAVLWSHSRGSLERLVPRQADTVMFPSMPLPAQKWLKASGRLASGTGLSLLPPT